MKKLLSTLAITSCIFASCSKDVSTSNNTQTALLKSFTINVAATSSNSAISAVYNLKYDSQKRLSVVTTFSDGDSSVNTFMYDGSVAYPTSVNTVSSDGTTSIEYYFFNSDGKIIKDSAVNDGIVRTYVYGNNLVVGTTRGINDPSFDGVDSVFYNSNEDVVKDVVYNNPEFSGNYDSKVESNYSSYNDKINPLYDYLKYSGKFLGKHLPGALLTKFTDFTGSTPPFTYNVSFTYSYDSQGRVTSWDYTISGIKLESFTFEYY